MKQRTYPTAIVAICITIGWSFSPLNLILRDVSPASVAVADELSDLIRDARTDDIIEGARKQISRPPADRSIRDLLRRGRWLHLNEHPSLAAQCYESVLDAATAQDLPNPKRLVVYRLAASIRMELGERENASDLLTSAIDISDQSEPAVADLKTGRMLHDLAVGYLQAKQCESAIRLFELASNHLTGEPVIANELGLAWATASCQARPLDAAMKLETFARKHPDHTDAANAMAKANQCYAIHLDSLSIEQLPALGPSMIGWIRTGGSPAQTRRWIGDARDESPTELATAWAQQLLKPSSLSPAEPLGTPTEASSDDAAETMPAETKRSLATIRELAANWLGRHGKWGTIAAIAESELAYLEDPTNTFSDEIGTAGLQRWFAESLMQVGRVDQALVWWNHLVEDRGASDFVSLLRCAEAETSAGDSIAKAKERIELARQAAGTDVRRQNLVHLLDAQRQIRSADFETSRRTLGDVLSQSQDDPAVAARAQWLIGETFYLGRRYEDAIEAYRKVENLAPTSEYAAASLIQAGKSFEQLGRTRQAAICYGHLLSRFDDSRHAEPARKRLARMEPMPPQIASRAPTDSPPKQDPNSSKSPSLNR